MTRIKVDFQGGESRNGNGACNYMIAEIESDGAVVELYAEVEVTSDFYDENGEFDQDGFDDYSYDILKASIIEQAEENNIDVDSLNL